MGILCKSSQLFLQKVVLAEITSEEYGERSGSSCDFLTFSLLFLILSNCCITHLIVKEQGPPGFIDRGYRRSTDVECEERNADGKKEK